MTAAEEVSEEAEVRFEHTSLKFHNLGSFHQTVQMTLVKSASSEGIFQKHNVTLLLELICL